LNDSQAHERPLERGRRTSHVDVPVTLFAVSLEAIFGTGACRLGTGDIDLFGRFGSIGKDGHVVVADFHEATGDRECIFLLRATDHEFAWIEGRHERCVPWQDSQLAFATRSDEHVHSMLHSDDAFRGHDFDGEGHD